jgi:hypothetical protein
MTLTTAMVTIAGAAYSSVAAPAKWEWLDHLHLGYAAPRRAM